MSERICYDCQEPAGDDAVEMTGEWMCRQCYQDVMRAWRVESERSNVPSPKVLREAIQRMRVALEKEPRRDHREIGKAVRGSVLYESRQKRRWTAYELSLLGTMPDEAVAAKIGRALTVVIVKRQQKKIRKFRHKV